MLCYVALLGSKHCKAKCVSVGNHCCKLMGRPKLVGSVVFYVPAKHNISHIIWDGRRFLQVKRLNQQYQSTEGKVN